MLGTSTDSTVLADSIGLLMSDFPCSFCEELKIFQFFCPGMKPTILVLENDRCRENEDLGVAIAFAIFSSELSETSTNSVAKMRGKMIYISFRTTASKKRRNHLFISIIRLSIIIGGY